MVLVYSQEGIIILTDYRDIKMLIRSILKVLKLFEFFDFWVEIIFCMICFRWVNYWEKSKNNSYKKLLFFRIL